MKRKVSSRIFLFCLLGFLIFAGAKQAFATEDAKKRVLGTICCANGVHTGNANDCVSSSTGACEDHQCLVGETEEAGGCPH